jgi:hypothetical protein
VIAALGWRSGSSRHDTSVVDRAVFGGAGVDCRVYLGAVSLTGSKSGSGLVSDASQISH